MDYTGASLLYKGHYNCENYYYFGVEWNGKLGTFGGGKEQADLNHPHNTAVREADEESHGVFGDKKKFKLLLQNWQNTGVQRIKNIYDQHVTYVVPVNTSYYNPMKKFAISLKQNHYTGCEAEMSEVVAVKEKDLRAAIDSGQWNVGDHVFRDPVQRTLTIARKAGII